MSKRWNPATVNAALTPQYLTPIADLLWNVQRKVSEHVEPGEGDDNWVAGSTAYTRRCFALKKMSAGPDREWLWAGPIDGQFAIRILGFPIRIYRAPEEGEIPTKYADGSTSEMALLGRAFALPLDQATEFLYRIEVVAKRLARPTRVSLVQIDETGKVANSYSIPRSAASVIRQLPQSDASVRPIRRRKPAVLPPAPEVQSTKPTEAQPRIGEERQA